MVYLDAQYYDQKDLVCHLTPTTDIYCALRSDRGCIRLNVGAVHADVRDNLDSECAFHLRFHAKLHYRCGKKWQSRILTGLNRSALFEVLANN